MADTSYTARARVVTVPVVASFRVGMPTVMAQKGSNHWCLVSTRDRCMDLTVKVG